MENKIPSVIARYDMLSRGDAVIVGTSGGADSMALLHWLFTHRDELGITVNACHINHNLRGEESLRDERFVRSFCEKLSIPLTVYSIEVITDKHESVEERARKMRYKCFDELCEKLSAKLATAHTASDNAETVLINILRGTGTKGLGGIPPVRGKIIRPLLRCTREDTESYCRRFSRSAVSISVFMVLILDVYSESSSLLYKIENATAMHAATHITAAKALPLRATAFFADIFMRLSARLFAFFFSCSSSTSKSDRS